MKNQFEQWTKSSAPLGRIWAGRAASLAAAGTATVAVGLSVVLMAGLNLPAGEAPVEARAPADPPMPAVASSAQSAQSTLHYATALPTVTIVGRRIPAAEAPAAAVEVGTLPPPAARPEETAGLLAAGDNLAQ